MNTAEKRRQQFLRDFYRVSQDEQRSALSALFYLIGPALQQQVLAHLEKAPKVAGRMPGR